MKLKYLNNRFTLNTNESKYGTDIIFFSFLKPVDRFWRDFHWPIAKVIGVTLANFLRLALSLLVLARVCYCKGTTTTTGNIVGLN